MKYYNCGNEEHFSYDCTEPKNLVSNYSSRDIFF